MKFWFMLGALLVCGLVGAQTPADGGLAAEQRGDTFTVGDIRLQGLQRVSAGTVFNVMPVSVGDRIDQIAVRQIIRNLFDSGYFSDVRVARDGDVLVIQLAERPAIQSIEIDGNRLIRTPQLMEGLAAQGLAEGEIFRRATLERVGLELERQYFSQGRYNASLETSVEELPRNRVAVKIDINEGRPSSIRHINIVGNEAFSNHELLGIMELKHPSWLSFIRNDDKYSREAFAGDLERIESFYLDRGFVEFQIESTHVSLTPDRSQVYLTINVDEGRAFEIDNVELIGEFRDINPEQLRPLLVVEPGQTFSRALVTRSEERLTAAMGNSGYTFASATGIPEIGEDGKVDLRFFVDAGQRAYVRRIEFSGNTVTQDEVLRREMRQMEGGWASTSMIELSKLRLERLGFFHEVDVETPEVPGTDNQIDVLFNVEEAPSGSVSATLGFAQGTGLFLGANLEQNNVLGSGNRFAFGVQWSPAMQSVNLSYFNPYYTLDGLSRGYNLSYRRTDFRQINLVDVETQEFAATMSFGLPLSETSRFDFGFGPQRTDIANVPRQELEINEFLDREGHRFTNVRVNAGWSSSTLDRALFPTRGLQHGLSAVATIPGSGLTYYRLSHNAQYYYPVVSGYGFRLRSRVSFGGAYGDTTRYPVIENFRAGGFNSVRGFQRNTLGPRATLLVPQAFEDEDGNIVQELVPGPVGNPLGGNLLVEGGLEFYFPMPFLPDSRSTRPHLFLDAGNVFNTDCADESVFCSDFRRDEIRYSVGIGINWLTAMGPMSFSYSRPFNAGPFDQVERFQFELGQSF